MDRLVAAIQDGAFSIARSDAFELHAPNAGRGCTSWVLEACRYSPLVSGFYVANEYGHLCHCQQREGGGWEVSVQPPIDQIRHGVPTWTIPCRYRADCKTALYSHRPSYLRHCEDSDPWSALGPCLDSQTGCRPYWATGGGGGVRVCPSAPEPTAPPFQCYEDLQPPHATWAHARNPASRPPAGHTTCRPHAVGPRPPCSDGCPEFNRTYYVVDAGFGSVRYLATRADFDPRTQDWYRPHRGPNPERGVGAKWYTGWSICARTGLPCAAAATPLHVTVPGIGAVVLPVQGGPGAERAEVVSYASSVEDMYMLLLRYANGTEVPARPGAVRLACHSIAACEAAGRSSSDCLDSCVADARLPGPRPVGDLQVEAPALVGVLGADYDVAAALRSALDPLRVGDRGGTFVTRRDEHATLLAASSSLPCAANDGAAGANASCARKPGPDGNPVLVSAFDEWAGGITSGVMNGLFADRSHVDANSSLTATVSVGGRDYWVDVVPISIAENAVDLLLFVVVPHDDFNTDTDRARQFLLVLTIGAAGVIIVIFTALEVGIVARPLRLLHGDMREVYASVSLEPDAAPRRTLFREIYNLSEAVAMLSNRLAEYRSYLPAAVLAECDEEPEVQPPTGQRKSKGSSSSNTLIETFRPLRLAARSSVHHIRRAREKGGQQQVMFPQLGSQMTRNALQCIVSQTAGVQRKDLEEFLTERTEACLKAGDLTSVKHLLDSGWDAPGALTSQVPPVTPTTTSPLPTTTGLPPATPLMGASLRFGFEAGTRRGTLLSGGSMSICPDGAKGTPTTNRYGDGAQAPGATVATVALFPPGYEAPATTDAVSSMATWHDPKGNLSFPSSVISDLLQDARTCYPAGPDAGPLALFTYSCELNHTVVWASWRESDSWGQVPCLDEFAAPSGYKSFGASRGKLGIASEIDCEELCELELLYDVPNGIQVFALDEEPRVVRYCSTCPGDPETCPLRDTVLWVQHPGSMAAPRGMLSLAAASEKPPVPPGVFEFITSRDVSTHISRQTWESVPLLAERLGKLRESCLAQKNQQRPQQRLCQAGRFTFDIRAAETLDGFTSGSDPDCASLVRALPILYKAKCPAGLPTPAQIAHACDLGLLQWQGQWAMHALTGEPRVMVPLGSDGRLRAEQLWRHNNALDSQPYALMNAAIRSQQNRQPDAQLETGGRLDVTLVARQPETPPPEPKAAMFEETEGVATTTTAIWTGQKWAVTLVKSGICVTQDEGDVKPQAWALPQYRALIWRLDAALRTLPTQVKPGQRRKGYRGLAAVVLDRAIYSRGKVVVFGAFTSTSDDQGVATGFAEGETSAAIFTMFGSTGRPIASWSRFGREKEVLYPPNTLHLVTEALSAEHAAILGKRQTQVFDLREVSISEAVTHLAKEGALELSRQHPGQQRNAEAAGACAEKGDWIGAAKELLAEPAPSKGPERRTVAPVLPQEAVGVVVLLFTSAAGSEIGPGIDQRVWSKFFARVESLAASSGARVISTHVGTLVLQVNGGSCGQEGAARGAVHLAIDLLATDDQHQNTPLPTRPPSLPPSPAQPQNPLLLSLNRIEEDPVSELTLSVSPPTPPLAGHAPQPEQRGPRGGCAYAPTGLKQTEMRVHCGVSVGTVYSGFAGSTKRHIEISDGPAVRRAHALAAYSLRFAVDEVVTDSTVIDAAARESMLLWTLDIVAFTTSDIQPVFCVAARSPSGSPSRMSVAKHSAAIQAAWDAVMHAANEPSTEASENMKDAIAKLPSVVSASRAAHALKEAARAPAHYCYELEGHFI